MGWGMRTGEGSEVLISRCSLRHQIPQISGDRGLSRCDEEPEPSEVQPARVFKTIVD